MGLFVPVQKGLCQFQPGLPLLGKSTVTQLVTWCVHWPVAKTSESSTKNKKGGWGGGSSPHLLHENIHTWTDIAAVLFPTTSSLLWTHQANLTVPRGALLNWNQVKLTGGEGKYKCHSVAEAGGIFSVNMGRIYQRRQIRLTKKKIYIYILDSREKADFKQRPFPGIIKS